MFRLVYTEATLRQLNDSISAGERGSAVATGTRGTPSRGTSDMRRQLDLSEEREEGEGEREGEGEGEGQGEGEGEGEEGATAEELVQEYMTRVSKHTHSTIIIDECSTPFHTHTHTLGLITCTTVKFIHTHFLCTHTHTLSL